MRNFCRRLLSAALAAALLCGALPAALAADDADFPLYEQYGYGSPEEFMADYAISESDLTYDMVSAKYVKYLAALRADSSLACAYYGVSVDVLAADYGSADAAYAEAAAAFVSSDMYDCVYGGKPWQPDELNETFAAYGIIPRALPPLSVQLNGEAVSFPDAQPEIAGGRTMVPFRAIAEAMGASVGWQTGGGVSAVRDGRRYSFTIGGTALTVTNAATGERLDAIPLDSAPYIKDSRTYVPVRFFGEAFGLTVEWDEYERTAVLYDRAALIAEIDAGFSSVNAWLAAQPLPESGKPARAAASLSVSYTKLDSIDGDKTYQLNGTLDVLSADGAGTELTVTADLRALLDALTASAWADEPEALAFAAAYKNRLKDAELEMIYDEKGDTLYLRCPLLFTLLASEMESAAAKAQADSWFRVENVLYALGLDEIGDLTAAARLTLLADVGSAGSFLVLQAEKAAGYGGWSEFYQDALDGADWLAGFAGDALFTQSGSRRTAKLDASSGDDEYGDAEQLTGGYTLDTATGRASASVQLRTEDWLRTSLTELTFEGSLAEGELTVDNRVQNQHRLVLHLTHSLAESADAPAVQPPEDAQVTDLDAWLYGAED